MQGQRANRRWKAEPLLGILALLLLLVGCLAVLKPFFTALVWAAILSYSLYPLQRVFTRWFRGYRTLAACFVTLTVTVLLAGPVLLIGMSLAQDGKDLALATRHWFMSAPDQAPEWVGRTPIVGDDLKEYWESFAEAKKRWMDQIDKEVDKEVRKEKESPPRATIVRETPEGLVPELTPSRPSLTEPAGPDAAHETPKEKKDDNDDKAKDLKDELSSPQMATILGRLLLIGRSVLFTAGALVWQSVTQVLLSAFLAFFLLRDAPELAERLAIGVERLAGERGRHLIKVAGDTVRGVIYGILGTAIAQALVAGIGFWIVKMPGAVLLSVLTFFFAVIPFGPPLIWGSAAIWLFCQDHKGYGVFMLFWGLLGISSVDNFLRPYLISQGSKMPFVLIFCGVIGGALAFGVVGVFLGPTLLAVGFRLIEEWSSRAELELENSPQKPESPPEPPISELPEKA